MTNLNIWKPPGTTTWRLTTTFDNHPFKCLKFEELVETVYDFTGSKDALSALVDIGVHPHDSFDVAVCDLLCQIYRDIKGV